jgi:predicted transcriptional regulator with HTH domain
MIRFSYMTQLIILFPTGVRVYILITLYGLVPLTYFISEIASEIMSNADTRLDCLNVESAHLKAAVYGHISMLQI